MKKILIIIGIILFIPLYVNAETLTYNVCKSGCEYNDLNVVLGDLQSRSNSNNEQTPINKNVIINIKDNEEYSLSNRYEIILSMVNEGEMNEQTFEFNLNSNDDYTFTINGNNNIINNFGLVVMSSYIEINNVKLLPLPDENIELENSSMIAPTSLRITLNNVEVGGISNGVVNEAIINNSKVGFLGGFGFVQKVNINNSEILAYILFGHQDGEIRNSNVGTFGCLMACNGNINFYDSKLDLITQSMMGLNITSSEIGKIINMGKINIYNPKKYLTHMKDEFDNIRVNYPNFNENDPSTWPTDIVDVYNDRNELPSENVYTYIYYTRDISLKPGSELNIGKVFENYLYEDIEWNSENKNVAIVNGLKVTSKNLGKTKITGMTDDGYIKYIINLNVANDGIIAKIEPESKSYANADFSSSDLNSVIPLTNEEQSLKDSGKNVDIFLEVKDASETVAKEEKKLIEEKLSSNEEIGTYLDVSLFKQVEGEEASKIEKTNGNITVSLNLPDDLINKDNKIKRTYYILRLHDGVVDKLDTNFDGKILTFETDRFSTYALTYKDEVISNVNNPKTGDNIIKYMEILFGSILLIVFIQVNKLIKE